MKNGSVSVDDIVILGNALPDEVRDNRKTVCTTGYSEEPVLIRIYPVPPDVRLTRWALVGLDLERNLRDSRKKAGKLLGQRVIGTVSNTILGDTVSWRK